MVPAKGEPRALVTRETSRAGPGGAVVLSAYILSYASEIYGLKCPHRVPNPFVPGSAAICRVEEVGPDAASLSPGQLVLLDMTVRARDNPAELYLPGTLMGLTEAAHKFAHEGGFRESKYAELARVPLGNCLPLYERAPRVGAGYGGAAVHAALALGARVVALGRNEKRLKRLAALGPRVSTVRITGDADAASASIKEKARGLVDVWMDLSPPEASGSFHFKSCVQALRYGGRISLMCAVVGVPLDISDITFRAETVKGTVMCSRDKALQVIKMAETGVPPLGPRAGLDMVGNFGLDSFQSALETAAKHNGPGEMVVMTP
ncbi:hypothetical protein diail_2339 [Diaporthe ilicicola]|nr:hypothetical protein diail_2339 [Diaporthe ilicicola]